MSKPFLRLTPDGAQKCLLCDCKIDKNQVHQELGDAGFQTIKDNATIWSTIQIPCSDEPYFDFTSVHIRIADLSTAHGRRVHKKCRTMFCSHVVRKELQYGRKPISKDIVHVNATDECVTNKSDDSSLSRQSGRTKGQCKHVCFICNTIYKADDKTYNDGGLGRCSEGRSSDRLKDCMKEYNKPGHRFEDAAMRLYLLLCGPSHDIYAVDVYYHKNCYSAFALPKTPRHKPSELETLEQIKVRENKVNDEFFELFKRKVIRDREAYLLTELLEDIKEISYDCDLQEPSLKHSYLLKQKLIERFSDQIGFHVVGRRQIVHPSGINPCLYAISTLEGAGLRDDDLTKAFARMVRRKLLSREREKWPISPEKLLTKLDCSGPLACIYNVILWSVNPDKPKNDFGYVATASKSMADKVWAICSDWETLITHERSTKSTALSLTIHRLTGSKEVASLLHRCGHGISYSDIRLINNTWASSVTSKSKVKLPMEFLKGKAIHVSIDNSDGQQQTLTGSHTTHHTNGIVFQTGLPTASTVKEHEPIVIGQDKELVDDDEGTVDYGSYKIPKKVSPPPFPDYVDTKDTHLIDQGLKRDIAWVLTSAVGERLIAVSNQEIEPIGSWTAFMKMVTNSVTNKSAVEYLEVVPLPPRDDVCKWYMDLILQMADDLELDCIFAHADEAVNCKMVLIKWLHDKKYDRIVTLIGGFHTLLVKLKIMHKKYGVLGFKEWWIDAGAVAKGSADQAEEGRHYYRSIRLHKQSFEALLRFRIEKHCNILKFSDELKQTLITLRCDPTPNSLNAVLEMPEFAILCDELLMTTGTESMMVVEYLRDVSSLLSLISAVREMNIEQHMQAERALLPQLFAFGHVNYARYLTYQHVMLGSLKDTNSKAWHELKQNGFGGSLSGEPFSAVHGDLIIETTINREVEVKGGPMQGGYSTNIGATNTFIKTSHLMAKLRSAMKNKLHILTSSVHKETTPGAKKQHAVTIHNLVEKLDNFLDPFVPGPARDIKTGTVIDSRIIEGLLRSTQTGENLYKEFIDDRIKKTGDDRVCFFKPIKNPKVKTGLEKVKREPRIVNILKEDKQAFGSLVGIYKYTLTGVDVACRIRWRYSGILSPSSRTRRVIVCPMPPVVGPCTALVAS